MHSYEGRYGGSYALVYKKVVRQIALLCRQVGMQLCTHMKAGTKADLHSDVGRQLCTFMKTGIEADMHSYIER